MAPAIKSTMEKQVEALGWQFAAQRTGTGKHGALLFQVTITGPRSTWSGSYSVGSEVPISEAKRAIAAGTWVRPKGWPIVKAQDVGPRTVYGRDAADRIRAAYVPKLADVVAALFVDAGGFPQSFRDWCEEWSPEGNPADALDMFQACERAYLFLAKNLSREQYEELEAISASL